MATLYHKIDDLSIVILKKIKKIRGNISSLFLHHYYTIKFIHSQVIFEKFKGNWEVQPMDNNPIAYSFWKNIISEYTNGNYITKNDGIEDVFIFNNK